MASRPSRSKLANSERGGGQMARARSRPIGYNAGHETATVQPENAPNRNCATQHSDGLGGLSA